jgi:hypothetical protein
MNILVLKINTLETNQEALRKFRGNHRGRPYSSLKMRREKLDTKPIISNIKGLNHGGRPYSAAMVGSRHRNMTTSLVSLGKSLQAVTEDLGEAASEKDALTAEVSRTRRALDASR